LDSILIFIFFSLGGGGVDGGGAGGGSSYSIGSNTVYTTGYQTGDGSITIEFYTNPTFKFSCTKSIQNLTVPLGYHYMYVDMSGAAAGGNAGGTGTGGIPGYGARVQSYLNVVPGTVLHVIVGCQGVDCPSPSMPFTGYLPVAYNGGGAGYGNSGNCGGSGGGGASDIRIGGLSLINRVVVAGGGGGSYCSKECATLKGGDAGQVGRAGTGCGRNAGGGSGAAGGTAGATLVSPAPSGGGLGFGGNGGGENSAGGGGGYYGGNRFPTN
jgi:hypothetical protein